MDYLKVDEYAYASDFLLLVMQFRPVFIFQYHYEYHDRELIVHSLHKIFSWHIEGLTPFYGRTYTINC